MDAAHQAVRKHANGISELRGWRGMLAEELLCEIGEVGEGHKCWQKLSDTIDVGTTREIAGAKAMRHLVTYLPDEMQGATERSVDDPEAVGGADSGAKRRQRPI
jgi:hypothetical protein